MKLDGIRVIDLSRFLPGPMMTQWMADHGAEVIKVESIDEGEPTRHIGAQRDGVSAYFVNANRGKQSLALDLKQAEAVELLLRLCAGADVFVEAFRPGAAQRLGLGYAQLAARAPRIVYASISAYGHSGPYRDRATHDLATQAMAGVLSLTHGQDGKPAIPGLAASDMLSATFALSGVLMALLRRHSTGRGDHLDLAMADTLVASLPNNMAQPQVQRQQPAVGEERALGGNALYRIYETADAQWIALGSQEFKFAVTLLSALGRPDLIELCQRPPGPAQHPVRDYLAATFKTRTRGDWVAWFAGRDIPFAPVQTLPEVLDDAHFRARGMVSTDARGWDHIGNPLCFADEPAQPDFAAPSLGQHTTPILRSLGLDEAHIQRLLQARVAHQAS